MVRKNIIYNDDKDVTLVEMGFGDLHLYSGMLNPKFKDNKQSFFDIIFKRGPQVPIGEYSDKTLEIVNKSKLKTEVVLRFYNINSLYVVINGLQQIRNEMLNLKQEEND